MNDLIPPTTEPPRLFSETQVTGAAVFFGPVAGGWLFRRNYIEIGKSALGQRAFFLSILFTIVIWIGGSLLPTDTLVVVYTLPSTAAFWFAYHKFFRPEYELAIKAGGRKLSFWAVIGLGIISVPATLLIGFVTLALVPVKPINHVAYGNNFIYYEQEATAADALALQEKLIELEAFVEDSYWELTLVMPRNSPHRVIIEWPISSVPEKNSELYVGFEAARTYLSETLYADKSEVWFEFLNVFGLPLQRIPDNEQDS